ncbi:MAG: hypothetical protein AAGC57_09295 [Pseudomonadota bacterium]
MHSVFDLRDGVSDAQFRDAWERLTADLIARGLLVSASGLLARRSDTPLDTDDGRGLRYLTVMSFQDRAQSEAAWDEIAGLHPPALGLHRRVLGMVAEPVFSCWEDLDAVP